MLLHLDDLEFGGSKGGRIWLTIGETAFPEEGWYDLPGVLLEQWMPGLESFFLGNTDSCELHFMDGPYKVCLNRAGGAGRRGLPGAEPRDGPGDRYRSGCVS